MVDWNPFSDDSWEKEDSDDIFGFGDKKKDRKAEAKGGFPESKPPHAPPLHGLSSSRGRPPFMDLPETAKPEPDRKMPFTDATQGRGPAAPARRKALIIDDNLMVRRNHSILLDKFGFEVVEAMDGRQGLDKLRKHGSSSFSIIMVDLMMPVMSGEEFVSTAKSTFGDSLPPVFVCTVSGDEPVVKTMAAKGIAGYILKPINFRTLALKLQSLFPDMEIKIPGEGGGRPGR